jgi:hypothetical protein
MPILLCIHNPPPTAVAAQHPEPFRGVVLALVAKELLKTVDPPIYFGETGGNAASIFCSSGLATSVLSCANRSRHWSANC